MPEKSTIADHLYLVSLGGMSYLNLQDRTWAEISGACIGTLYFFKNDTMAILIKTLLKTTINVTLYICFLLIVVNKVI
jgi:hypothetical protein